jgi:hypothetical protein
MRPVQLARTSLRYTPERVVMAWDTRAAAKRPEQAYFYVSRTLPQGTDYSPLDSRTDAAYEAEKAGDWPAYVEALRELCRAARR